MACGSAHRSHCCPVTVAPFLASAAHGGAIPADGMLAPCSECPVLPSPEFFLFWASRDDPDVLLPGKSPTISPEGDAMRHLAALLFALVLVGCGTAPRGLPQKRPASIPAEFLLTSAATDFHS